MGIVAPNGQPLDGVDRTIKLAHELPFAFVDSYAGIVETIRRETGVLPAFGWTAGDANTPSHWGGAANTTPRLSAVGAPASGHSPWQTEDTAAFPAENYDGASRRQSTDDAVIPDGDDLVAAALFRSTYSAAAITLSCFSAGGGRLDGLEILPALAAIRGRFGAAGAYQDARVAFPSYQDAWVFVVLVVDRDGTIKVYANATLGGTAPACPVGSCAPSKWAVGDRPGGAGALDGSITFALALTGSGIADAVPGAIVSRLTRRALGIERRTGHAGPAFVRNTPRSWQDRNRRHHIASAHLPRAGDAYATGESGIRLAPGRTNKCYQNINTTVAGAGVWTVDDASAVARVDDSAAFAGASEDISAWGPFVCRYANASGASRYMWIPGQTGNTNTHALQVAARIVAGAGAQLGWWSVGGAAWTNVVALSSGYLRTVANNLTPPANDCCLAIHVPNGCEVRWIAHQSEEAVIATSPIPNWSTIAGAAAAAEVLTLPVTPWDGEGGYELGITPIGWSAADVGGFRNLVMRRSGGVGYLLYSQNGAGGKWRFSDFTNNAEEAVATAADGTRQVIKAGWTGSHILLDVDGTRVVNTYDGDLHSTGTITLAPENLELAIDSLKLYRRHP